MEARLRRFFNTENLKEILARQLDFYNKKPKEIAAWTTT